MASCSANKKLVAYKINKAYADAYKDAGKPVTKVGINFNVENEANFTEWVIK